jgi:hypothetical protein
MEPEHEKPFLMALIALAGTLPFTIMWGLLMFESLYP